SPNACGTASEATTSAPIAASSTTRTAPSSEAARLASHTYDSQLNHSAARIASPSKSPVHDGSCAMNPVTWVIAKTKTRSKKSSSGETRCSTSTSSTCLGDGGARGAQPRGLAQLRGLVGALPREVVVLAPEVAVGGGLLVDRPVQLQVLAERAGAQIEVL